MGSSAIPLPGVFSDQAAGCRTFVLAYVHEYQCGSQAGPQAVLQELFSMKRAKEGLLY